MKKVRDEIVREEGTLYELICWITNNCGIATSDLLETHWRNKFKDGDFFWTWYGSQIINKAVHPIKRVTDLDPSIKRKIRVDFKLPDDTFVMGCIKCAHTTQAPKYILADDIYFYEPSAKGTTVSNQQRIMENRTGQLCRYLERAIHIRVGTAGDCASHFSMATGNCSAKPITSVNQCPHI